MRCYAIPGFLAAAFASAVAASGCGPAAPVDPGVPAAATLVTDLALPAGGGAGSAAVDAYELPSDGALYVVDATAGRVAYSGAVRAGEVLKLSWLGVNVSGRLPGQAMPGPNALSRAKYERPVASYVPGRRYRVYYDVKAEPVNPTSDAGSPLTRPFEVRERRLDPTQGQRPQ